MNSLRGEEAEFALLKCKKITMRGTGTKMKSTKTHTSKQRQQGTKKPRLLPSTLKSYCTEQKSQVSRRLIVNQIEFVLVPSSFLELR